MATKTHSPRPRLIDIPCLFYSRVSTTLVRYFLGGGFFDRAATWPGPLGRRGSITLMTHHIISVSMETSLRKSAKTNPQQKRKSQQDMDTDGVGMFVTFVLLLYIVMVLEIDRRRVALEEEFHRDGKKQRAGKARNYSKHYFV